MPLLRPGLSLGLGASQDAFGLGLEVRSDHFGAAAGLGIGFVGFLAAGLGPSWAGSLRYFSEPGRGTTWMFAVNGGLWAQGRIFDSPNEHFWVVTVSAARRQYVDRWFWQIGLGAGVVIDRLPHSTSVYPIPDLVLAGGYEF
ncbi:MAG: hypothetical protein JST92_04740 [Deltaproteobacteria bacterium]|nr:hypothetical protein [Deltaproteobacteria bacterium]